jgi:DNA-binding CsgD family transcriptional regulator
VSPVIHRTFIQQALFYNISIILTAIGDFLIFFFWKEVSGSRLALVFLSLVNISSLAIALLWCIFFIILIYKLLELPFEPKLKEIFKYSAVIIILLFLYCFISSIFNLTYLVFRITSVILSCTVFVVTLGYSIFLYKKSALIETGNKRKSLIIFSRLFLVYSSISILVYTDGFFLHLFPAAAVRFSFNALDLLFNALTFFWGYKYFGLLASDNAQLNLETVSEEELISKFQISKRELEVIHLVCSGKSNQEIADLLFISIGTVKNHLYNIYAKIGIKNRTQLAKLF